MKTVSIIFLASLVLFLITDNLNSQITERERPKEWNELVKGGRFMDRFLPIPVIGKLTEDTWGADDVVPRYIDNGIEDPDWSYWGGNAVVGDDGKCHLFVCRWAEDSPKGHMQWSESVVVHAISNSSFGPYKVVGIIGPGHNPEIFQLKDGRYVIYVIDGHYIAEELNGPWKYGQFKFDPRDRQIIEGLSNLSFAQREDGSYLMVCRGGGIWFSKDGLSTFHQVSDKRVYPPVDGRFEDPVVWKTKIQYHMVVNDWLGRIAYYLRSKDGINWKVDTGEAYLPGLAKYEDGTQEDWFKYERFKVLQDEYGRAIQAHFAVIDTIKWNDLSNDHHSSKHICIPLTVGRLINLLNKDKIDEHTATIRLEIKAEDGFDPHNDIDISSLRFGASEEVNFGKGSKVLKTERSGNDLIVIFDGSGNGLTESNFVAKLLGKTRSGNLLFGYARLPWVDYLQPALSARLPVITQKGKKTTIEVEVQNFGQVESEPASIVIEHTEETQFFPLASGIVPKLKPYEKTVMKLKVGKILKAEGKIDVKVSVFLPNQSPVELHGKVKILKH